MLFSGNIKSLFELPVLKCTLLGCLRVLVPWKSVYPESVRG